jgi:DNA-binding MarR family transcriptional regulator
MERERDVVDDVIEEWNREWPQYDVAPRELFMRLARIATHLERRTKAVLSEHGLTFYGFKILTALRRAGPTYRLTPGELSRTLIVFSGTLTHQLDQLEEAGLITRLPDPNDRRGVLVELTDLGRSRVETALLANNRQQKLALAPLSPEERDQASAILRKVLIHLEEGAKLA